MTGGLLAGNMVDLQLKAGTPVLVPCRFSPRISSPEYDNMDLEMLQEVVPMLKQQLEKSMLDRNYVQLERVSGRCPPQKQPHIDIPDFSLLFVLVFKCVIR